VGQVVSLLHPCVFFPGLLNHQNKPSRDREGAVLEKTYHFRGRD
jgi:hypothetical protein